MNGNTLIDRTMAAYMEGLFRFLPIITMTGPRQSGKTTLCRNLFPNLPYANLEDISTLTELRNDPKAFFSKYPSGVIIDEAQNYPDIFSYLQVEVDNDRMNGISRHFIVTGSNNFSLMEKTTQSMAGRTAVLSLLPLSTEEVASHTPDASTSELILRGGYPSIWTHELKGREILMSSYYTTYVERDLRSLINIKDLSAFQTFIRLCAGRIGQEFNASAISIEVGVSVPTIKQWLSILSASYIVYLLHPYYANIGKRLTKTPKLYFYDTGLASYLLGINTIDQMNLHPLRGSLFENMVINDIIKKSTNQGKEPALYFYRDKSQREVDILSIRSDNRIDAFEIKAGKTYNTDYFKNLKYLRSILGDKISTSAVIYDGEQENYQTTDGYCNFRNIHRLSSSPTAHEAQ